MVPTKIIVHHSLTADSGTVSWNAIRKYHMETNGWSDIGYHAGVELVETAGIKSYEILMGRIWDVVGAHATGFNSDSLGICFVGNYDLIAPPEKMLSTGAKVIALWLRVFGIEKAAIYRHSDFNLDKSCPGTQFPFSHLLEIVDTFL